MDKKQLKGEEPNVGNDPMQLPQTGVNKKIVAPDPEKVRHAEREKAKRQEQEAALERSRTAKKT